MALNYSELRKARKNDTSRKAVSEFPADVAAKRQKEKQRRAGTARARVVSILIELHRAEFDELYPHAIQEVNAESGPLPGDPGYKDTAKDSNAAKAASKAS